MLFFSSSKNIRLVMKQIVKIQELVVGQDIWILESNLQVESQNKSFDSNICYVNSSKFLIFHQILGRKLAVSDYLHFLDFSMGMYINDRRISENSDEIGIQILFRDKNPTTIFLGGKLSYWCGQQQCFSLARNLL